VGPANSIGAGSAPRTASSYQSCPRPALLESTNKAAVRSYNGKDRHPFPVPLKAYDETIRVLKSAVQKAKLGKNEELSALERLDEESRRLERFAKGPGVEALIAEEQARSHAAYSDGSLRPRSRRTNAAFWQTEAVDAV
jgi:hypothetical protein